MRADDAQQLLGVFGDPEVMRAFDRGPFDRPEMAAWVNRNLQHQDRYGFGLFVIVERATGEVIGDCGLERMELDGVEETELGYDLRSDRWGHGFATEAAATVKDHALDRLGLHRVISLVRAGNERSSRVAERIGMSFERELVRGEIAYRLYAAMPASGRGSGA